MSKTLAEKLKALDKFSEGFNKAKGKVVAGRLSRHEELVDRITVKFLPTPSLNVNAAMGGGFPIGRTTIVTGKEDSGKTFILLESISMHMKADPTYVAGWLESEESITIETLDMFGIDPERFFYLVPSVEGAEETLNAVLSTIAGGGVDFFVVNSLKCLVPSEELIKGVEKLQVGLAARMNAKMMRKITPVIADTRTALVLVQHLTTNIGSMSRDLKIA